MSKIGNKCIDGRGSGCQTIRFRVTPSSPVIHLWQYFWSGKRCSIIAPLKGERRSGEDRFLLRLHWRREMFKADDFRQWTREKGTSEVLSHHAKEKWRVVLSDVLGRRAAFPSYPRLSLLQWLLRKKGKQSWDSGRKYRTAFFFIPFACYGIVAS